MGPPYLNPPPEKYIVISEPWGMPTAHQRTLADFERVGGWVRRMLMEQSGELVPEVLYHKRTVILHDVFVPNLYFIGNAH
jgi:hypothetical protein